MKIPDCDRCVLYARTPYVVCTIHPQGVDTEKCLDFRPDPNFKEEEKWSPVGYSWYDDKLITNRLSRYTPQEQLEILDNHPFFTGVCPVCRHEFDKNNPPTVHWNCPNPDCGWIDDSV